MATLNPTQKTCVPDNLYVAAPSSLCKKKWSRVQNNSSNKRRKVFAMPIRTIGLLRIIRQYHKTNKMDTQRWGNDDATHITCVGENKTTVSLYTHADAQHTQTRTRRQMNAHSSTHLKLTRCNTENMFSWEHNRSLSDATQMSCSVEYTNIATWKVWHAQNYFLTKAFLRVSFYDVSSATILSKELPSSISIDILIHQSNNELISSFVRTSISAVAGAWQKTGRTHHRLYKLLEDASNIASVDNCVQSRCFIPHLLCLCEWSIQISQHHPKRLSMRFFTRK